MQDRSSADVVVVGAGLAGLAFAALAGRAGLHVVVCERAGTTGGRARTQRRSGFAFNQGPHALYAGGALAGVLADLDIRVTGAAPAVSGGIALAGDACHALPGGPVSLLTTGLFGLTGKLETAKLLGRIPRIDPASLADVSVATWLRRDVRHPGVRSLVAALVRLATYANAPEQLSAGLALAQLQQAVGRGVRYLDGGWQSLVDALEERAIRAGVEIRAAAAVTRIEPGGAGVTLRDGTVVPARAVVVALDAAAAADLLPDGAARRYAAAAVPVRAACLDVGLSRLPRPAARFALGIDRPLYCSVHSAVARLAPEGGALIHVARYLGDDRPDPRAVEAELEGVLDRVQPGWRDCVLERRFLPELVAASALGTAATGGLRDRPGPALPERPGVFVIGDWVGPEGWLADASAASARQAAALVVSALRGGRAAAA